MGSLAIRTSEPLPGHHPYPGGEVIDGHDGEHRQRISQPLLPEGEKGKWQADVPRIAEDHRRQIGPDVQLQHQHGRQHGDAHAGIGNQRGQRHGGQRRRRNLGCHQGGEHQRRQAQRHGQLGNESDAVFMAKTDPGPSHGCQNKDRGRNFGHCKNHVHRLFLMILGRFVDSSWCPE